MNTKLTPNPFSDTQHMPVPEVEPLEPVTFVRPRLQNDPLEPLDVDPATSAALTAVWEQTGGVGEIMLTDKEFDDIEANAAWFYINKNLVLLQSKMQAAYDYGRRVKQLEWLKVDNERCESEGAFGYWIGIQSAEDSVAPFTLYCGEWELGDCELGDFSSLDDAKAACQAHHKSIILGALE